MLADLDLAPMRSLAQAAQGLYILAHPESPMRGCCWPMRRQLSLSVPPARRRTPRRPAPQPGAVSDTRLRLQAVLGVGRRPSRRRRGPATRSTSATRRCASWSATGRAAPIDQVLAIAGRPAAAARRSWPPPGARRRRRAAGRRAIPRWLAAGGAAAAAAAGALADARIASSGIALRSGSPPARSPPSSTAPGGPAALCAAAVIGRYPFVPAAPRQTYRRGYFARVFAPGGLIDGFFNTLLRPYVDMSGRAWKPQSADRWRCRCRPPSWRSSSARPHIRDVFFAAGRTTPSFRFDITPVSVDRATPPGRRWTSMGTVLGYRTTRRGATQITWPGAGLHPAARLAFDPPPAGRSGVWQESGPWSLFRLFSRGRLQQSAGGKYSLTLQAGERQAVFEIRAGSSLGPGILQEFHCPVVQ